MILSMFSSDRVFIFLFLFIPLFSYSNNDFYRFGNKDPSFNIFGESGIIVIPSAEIKKQGSVNFSFSNNNIFKYGSLTVSPFNWLEASYFYYRPKDLFWDLGGPSTKGQYLDKGFSIKLNSELSEDLTVAIGLSDFAGTGFFTREYIISTYSRSFYKITAGLGFGSFAYKEGFSNPLGSIIKEFQNRPVLSSAIESGKGGSLSTDQWFKGDANLIFGAEFFLPGKFNKTSIKLDYDPFDYINDFTNRNRPGTDYDLRKKDSNLNLGINFAANNYLNFGVNFVKGNTFNFSITIGNTFNDPFFRKKLPKGNLQNINKGNSSRSSFYEDLIFNINNKNIFLQSAQIKDGILEVAVATSSFRNPIHAHAVLGDTVIGVKSFNNESIHSLTTIGVNVGNELYRITTPLEKFEAKERSYTEIVAIESTLQKGKGDDYRSFEFRPTIKYPAFFYGATPALVNHIGDPAKFYYGGVVLRFDNEIQLSSRLQINTEIHQNVINNFNEKRNFPDSRLPNVRTDIVSYLQESDTYISRMQLDYFFNPYNEIFGKLSAGILENMYSGAGFEFLYKPFEQNFSVGLEAYRVKKRAFNRKFDLLDYEINTGHINFNYHLPRSGILGTLSYGKYLAGDEGYTFDISRRLSSGFRAGIFFTRTNVSAEQFGEGSFDKGFYFQIPIDLFLNDYRGGYINFKLRPLTRDGGQKLEAGNDLIGIMHSTSRAEIERDWVSFND